MSSNEEYLTPREKLVIQKEHLQNQLRDMKVQMWEAQAKVHTTGKYSDPEWFTRLRKAMMIVGRKVTECDRQLRQMKISEKEASALCDKDNDRLFIEIARERLPLNIYLEFWQEVEKRTKER